MEVDQGVDQIPGLGLEEEELAVKEAAPCGMEGVRVQLAVHPTSQAVQLSVQVPAGSGGDADMPPADVAEGGDEAANGSGGNADSSMEGAAAPGAGADPWEALHEEVVRFAREAAPDAEEVSLKQAALESIQGACREALANNKRMRVQLFGSGAHGISLRSSDLDVVITNFITPSRQAGFVLEQKEFVGQSLKRICDALVRTKAVAAKPFVIFNARLPVAKLEMSNGVRADITVGSEDGPRAAAFLREQQQLFPALRPLCMVVKSLLQRAAVHEAAKGGISTWACCNMGLALLQEQSKAGYDTRSLGHLLLGFLKFYGTVFNARTQAVAVGQGGLVPRAEVTVTGGGTPAKTACVFRTQSPAGTSRAGRISTRRCSSCLRPPPPSWSC